MEKGFFEEFDFPQVVVRYKKTISCSVEVRFQGVIDVEMLKGYLGGLSLDTLLAHVQVEKSQHTSPSRLEGSLHSAPPQITEKSSIRRVKG